MERKSLPDDPYPSIAAPSMRALISTLVVASIPILAGAWFNLWGDVDQLERLNTELESRNAILVERLASLETEFKAYRDRGDRLAASDRADLLDRIESTNKRLVVFTEQWYEVREAIQSIKTEMRFLHVPGSKGGG